MRTQPRESWLVPLLVVPLVEITLSGRLTDADLLHFGGPTSAEGGYRGVAGRARPVIDAVLGAEHGLTDDDAAQLVRTCVTLLPLRSAFLYPPACHLAGAGILVGLQGEPLRRQTARWILDGPQSPACSALIAAHTLGMEDDVIGWIPRAESRYAMVTRAIDRRMQQAGAATWEEAIALAHRHWANGGWRDLQVWQVTAEIVMTREYIERPAQRREAEAESRLAHERAERARLQATLAELEHEVQALRPLKDKVDGLRVEAERLRLRDAELVHARDRALAHVESLEAAVARLECQRAELERRIAELSRPAVSHDCRPLPAARPRLVVEPPLPATLLAGREVYFFTGDVRRSSAEETARSLRELGASGIRTYCVQSRKGGIDGPDSFPAGSLVVVDIRWLGHSQSRPILDRAERNGVEHLVVRSGKGGLARVVAAALAA
jgi:hypothetical protein